MKVRDSAVLATIGGLAILVIGIIGLVTLNSKPNEKTESALLDSQVVDESTVNEETIDSQDTDPIEIPENSETKDDNPIEVAQAIDNNYSIVVTSTIGDKTETFAEILVESENRSYSRVEDGPDSVEFIIYDDSYYTFTEEDQWIKFTNDQFDGQADYVAGFTLTDEDIAEIKRDAILVGKEPCGDAMCEIYKSKLEGDEATVKINTQTKQILSISGNDATFGILTIIYDYETPITITLPSDYLDVTELEEN